MPAALRRTDAPKPGLQADGSGFNAGKADLMLKINGADAVRMKYIPAGTYMQGSYFFRGWRYQDEYPHPVTLQKAFYMMEVPVTQKMWKDCGFAVPAAYNAKPLPANTVGDNKALYGATFDQMTAFISALAAENGLSVATGAASANNTGVLRLPTDAEWEYAMRLGNSNVDFQDKYFSMHTLQSDDVRSRDANGWGLYAMMMDNVYHYTATGKIDNVRVAEADPLYGFYGTNTKAKGGTHYNCWAPSMHGKGYPNGGTDEGTFMTFRLIVTC